MRPFPTATCFHETDTKRSICICFLMLLFPIFPCAFEFPFVSFSALGSSCIMTKRDSLLAGFTYPSSSMSMPRRHSRTSGYPSSTAAPSDSLNPSRSVTDSTASTALPTALPSLRHAGSSDQTSHYGYSTADTSTPIPAPADHQTPIPPRREEAYPLQREMAETRRQLHAHYFTEVRTPQADNSHLETPNLSFGQVFSKWHRYLLFVFNLLVCMSMTARQQKAEVQKGSLVPSFLRIGVLQLSTMPKKGLQNKSRAQVHVGS